MLPYKKYVDDLNESLNSAKLFTVTNDSKIPTEIYATFNVDGKKYSIALLQTNAEGIYILEIGKSTGKNTMWWKFHSPKDVPAVLSTALSFANYAIYLLKTRLKGIAVRLRASSAFKSRSAIKIAERLIKRVHQKTFTYYPSTKDEETGDQFIFFGKKIVPPQTLFKGKTFKGYSFEQGTDIDFPVLDSIESKKKLKRSVSDIPSKKYNIGDDMHVDVSGLPEDSKKLVDIISKIEPKKVEGGSKPIEDYYYKDPKVKATTFAALKFFRPIYDAAVRGIYNPGDWDFWDIENAMHRATDPSISIRSRDAIIKVLRGIGFLGSGIVPFKENLAAILGYVSANIKELNTASHRKEIEKIHVKLYDENTKIKSTVEKTEIDPKTLPVGIEGYAPIEEYSLNRNYAGRINLPSSHDTSIIEKALESNYGKSIRELKNFTSVKDYTGENYRDYNNDLRGVFSSMGSEFNKGDVEYILGTGGRIDRLAQAFRDMKRLEFPIWVFRGFRHPDNSVFQVGSDFVDPAFMSTTIKPSIANKFGDDNAKLRIYLPRGSNVIPMLGYSEMDNEGEVILPPASVLKIIEKETLEDRMLISAVFIGSAYESMLTLIKKRFNIKESFTLRNLIMQRLEEDKKEDKKKSYDAAGKFGGPMDQELSDSIIDLIKAGKIKVDAPKLK